MGGEIAGAMAEAVFVDQSGQEFRSTGMFMENAEARLSHGACS